jgi:hypothetical protein
LNNQLIKNDIDIYCLAVISGLSDLGLGASLVLRVLPPTFLKNPPLFIAFSVIGSPVVIGTGAAEDP